MAAAKKMPLLSAAFAGATSGRAAGRGGRAGLDAEGWRRLDSEQMELVDKVVSV